MPQATISNPQAANRIVADHTLGRDQYGLSVDYPNDVESWRANAAVTKGQALMFVAPTVTVPLSVTPMTVAGADDLFVGVALEPAAAGDMLRVVRSGTCLANFGAGVATAGQLLLLPTATTGVFVSAAATAITETAVGRVWGIKGVTDLLALVTFNSAGIASPDEVA